MLLLNIDRKPYMGSPIAPSHLTLTQGHQDFKANIKANKADISQRSLDRPYATIKH